MFKKLFSLVLVFCLSITLIFLLYSYSTRKTKENNGFSRVILKERVILQNRVDLDKDLFSINNITDNEIKIIRYRKPFEHLFFSHDLKKRTNAELSPLLNKEKFEGLNSVASFKDTSLVISGRTAMAYKIGLGTKMLEEKKLDALPFYHSEALSLNSFVILSKVEVDGENRRKLKKVNWQGQEITSYFPIKQVDGYFCTDGMFTYDKKGNRFIYMYYYRGLFTCLDTNLNVVYNSKTVDTITQSKIQLKPVGNMITQATPPSIVNRRFCIANNNVYLHSALKADNENQGDFDNMEVIDVYDLKNGKYSVSFYLPRIEKHRLTEFKIYNQLLVALYGNILVVFKIPSLNPQNLS